MIFSEMKTIFMEPDIMLGAPEMIFVVWKIKFFRTKKINTVALKIIGALKKIVSTAGLILDAAEKNGSKRSKIADKTEMILNGEFSNLFGKEKAVKDALHAVRRTKPADCHALSDPFRNPCRSWPVTIWELFGNYSSRPANDYDLCAGVEPGKVPAVPPTRHGSLIPSLIRTRLSRPNYSCLRVWRLYHTHNRPLSRSDTLESGTREPRPNSGVKKRPKSTVC